MAQAELTDALRTVLYEIDSIWNHLEDRDDVSDERLDCLRSARDKARAVLDWHEQHP